MNGRIIGCVLAVAAVGVAFHADATPVLEVSRCSQDNLKYMATGGNAHIVGTVAVTFECWINQPSFDGENQILNQDGSGGKNPGRFFFQTRNGSVTLNIGGNTKISQGTLTANTWHHIAAVRDADGNTTFYIDGVAESPVYHSKTAFADDTNTGFTIGALPRAGAAGAFRGRLAELRVWTVARTGEQIRADMKHRLAGNENGLAFYWPMREGVGSNVWEAVHGWCAEIVGPSYVTWVDDADFPIAEVPVMRSDVTSDTVALWPLDRNVAAGTWNFRNVLGMPGTDLLPGPKIKATEGADWLLPPNPDTAVDVRIACNGAQAPYIPTGADGGSGMMAYSEALGYYTCCRRPFTLEGYVRFNDLPSASYPSRLIVSSLQGENKYRIFASLQWRDSAVKLHLWGTVLTDSTDLYGDAFTAEETVALTNSYHHYALVFDPDANGYAVSKLYWDGVEKFSHSRAAVTSFGTPEINHRLDIGGRAGEGTVFCRASFDYWRLSKVALTPAQFLNAGGDAQVVARSKTEHYWRLEPGDAGRASIGEEDLHGGVPYAPGGAPYPTMMSLSTDHAPTPAWLGENTGSLYGQRSSAYLSEATLGTSLSLDKPFTVEGWFKPIRTKTSPELQIMLSTRGSSQNGWNLAFDRRNQNGGSVLTLYAGTEENGGTTLVMDAVMSDDLSAVHDWMHVALTYTPDEGNGTWRTYINGTLARTVENAKSVYDAYSPLASFLVGGRGNDNCFYGGIDTLRVSGAVLTPDQFLCGANGESAPSTLALWPFDTVNGVYFDGRDIKGSHTFSNPKANFVATSTDAPVIANPERNPSFRGDPTAVCGSYDLTTNRRAYLGFTHGTKNADNFVVNHEPFTFECYLKRTAAPAEREVLLYNTLGATTESYGYDRTLFYLMIYGKLLVNDGTWESNPTDRYFTEDTDLFPMGVWTHLAIVRTFEGDNVCHELFINGVSRGKVSGPAKASAKLAGVCMVGGRPGLDSAFNGLISSVRITRAALAPAEFLCGAHPSEDLTLYESASERAGTSLGGLAALAPPFGAFTLEAKFAWSGEDGVIAESSSMSIAVKNGQLAVCAKGLGTLTPVFDAEGLYTLTSGKAERLAFVFSPSSGLKVYSNRTLVATVKGDYALSAESAIGGDLMLGSAATGDLGDVRLSAAALDRKDLLFDRGLMVILR